MNFEELLKKEAKTLQAWMDEVVYVRQGKLLVPENPEQVAEKLVSVEVLRAFSLELRRLIEDFEERHNNGGLIEVWKIDFDEWKKKVLGVSDEQAQNVVPCGER